MYKILFITNYKRDNQYSMERYSKTHINLVRDINNFRIDTLPISNIIFKTSENKLIRFLNKYFIFPIFIFFKSFSYHLVHISDSGNAYLKLFILNKTIITCHDLIPFKFPKKDLKNIIYRWLNKKGMLKSSFIVTASKSTTKDFLKIIKKNQSLEYIYTPYIQKKFIGKKNIPSKYKKIVHIGSIDYKNRFLALEIINKLKKYNYKLICIGKLNENEKHFIKKYKLYSYIDEKVKISENEKLKIINNADIILLTSKYEGYGFPVLEGYSQNTLVISSDRGSLRELVLKKALVKKYNCKNFVHKILELNKNIKIKNKLINENKKILNKINNIKNYKNFYKNIYKKIYYK